MPSYFGNSWSRLFFRVLPPKQLTEKFSLCELIRGLKHSSFSKKDCRINDPIKEARKEPGASSQHLSKILGMVYPNNQRVETDALDDSQVHKDYDARLGKTLLQKEMKNK